MPLRVQPADIEILSDNPFANDLLEREEAIGALTTLLGNIDGPCVIAVDERWGMGKTTFLRLWSQYLEDNCFPVLPSMPGTPTFPAILSLRSHRN